MLAYLFTSSIKTHTAIILLILESGTSVTSYLLCSSVEQSKYLLYSI